MMVVVVVVVVMMMMMEDRDQSVTQFKGSTSCITAAPRENMGRSRGTVEYTDGEEAQE